MLILTDTDGNKVLISPRFFVAAAYSEADEATAVYTTNKYPFLVKDTVDEIIEAIQKSTTRQVVVQQ